MKSIINSYDAARFFRPAIANRTASSQPVASVERIVIGNATLLSR